MAAIDVIPPPVRGAAVRGLLSLPRPLLRAIAGRPVIVGGQRLDPEAQVVLRLLALTEQGPPDEMTVAEARAHLADDTRAFAGPKVELARVEEVTIAGPGGSLGGRLYVPHSRAADSSRADGPRSLLVYFHGGGFVVGDLNTHDNACRFLARQARTRVLAVDYRLAPEHPFPAGLEDAVAAFRFAVEHAAELGADANRIGVGGDSAGGNLAAGVARLVAGDGERPPACQVLFYPWLDLAGKRASYRLFGDGFYLTEADLDWYKAHYVANEHDAQDPRCSPLLAEDLAGVAPAYIATAGFDPLRDDGEDYAARLRSAGVRVALRRHAGLVHGFVNTTQVGRSGREAVLEAAGVLQFALAA